MRPLKKRQRHQSNPNNKYKISKKNNYIYFRENKKQNIPYFRDHRRRRHQNRIFVYCLPSYIFPNDMLRNVLNHGEDLLLQDI